MRVYVPDKKDAIINEVLKELYLLRQAIEHGAGSTDSKLKTIDNIRNKLQDTFSTKE